MRRFSRVLMFALTPLLCLAGVVSAEENLIELSRAAVTGPELIRVEMMSEWRSAGFDRVRYPKSFECQVQVAIDSFTPEEMAAIDAFARDRTSNNFGKSQRAIQQRDSRVDMAELTERTCAQFKGS